MWGVATYDPIDPPPRGEKLYNKPGAFHVLSQEICLLKQRCESIDDQITVAQAEHRLEEMAKSWWAPLC